MTEAPKRIWLQRPCTDPENDWCGDVTWCEDKQNDDDTEYVRADEIETLRRRVKYLESEAAERPSAFDYAVLKEELDVMKAGHGEPVAWMHESPERVDVIHSKVKALLQSAGHLHRPLDKSEKYTIPLYTSAPTIPAGQKVTVDTEGVRFGKGCWMSHEAVTGCSAEQLNAGICGVIGKQYMEWVQTMIAAAPKYTKEMKCLTT